MKKIFSAFSLWVLFFWISTQNIYAEEKKFVVTAYYSPLPNQENYVRWTYEKEIILQWNWTHWASWKPVFSGMLAASKKYDFWTKIYIEWLWVWVVEDRGQAIVSKGERWYQYDRIDVWMWYGDEWLKRALAWWKRTVSWEVLDSWAEITIDYKSQPLAKIKEKTVFDFSVWKDSSSEDIKKLQEFFKKINLYSWKIDWSYNNEIINIVFEFQIKNWILSSESDIWAGYWWEKTRKLFKEKYENWDFDVLEENIEEKILEESPKFELEENLEEIIENEKIDKYDIFWPFVENEENIKSIEKIFSELWYETEITWAKENLSKIVLSFQLEENIISSEKETWAWYFWPKTRAKLKEKYDLYQKEQQEFLEKINTIAEKYENIENEARQRAEEKMKNLTPMKKWHISQEVRELQNILFEIGYFSEKSTAIYGDKTVEAIKNFQIDNDLIDSENSIYAWIAWEKTLEKIKDYLADFYKNNSLDWTISEEDLDLLFSQKV